MKVHFTYLLWTIFVLNASSQSSRDLLTQIQKSQPDTTRVQLLLDLSRQILLKSGANAKDIDSSYRFMKQAQQLSNQLKDIKGQGNTLLMEALILYKRGDKNQGLKIAERAFDVFASINDRLGEGNAYVIIGQHYGNDGKDLDQKMYYYNKGIELFRQIGAKERLATSLVDLADLQYGINNDYRESIKNLREALRIYQEIGYAKMEGLYDLLGAELASEGDFVSSLKYELLALKTAQKVRDTTLQLCTIYNRTGVTYIFLRRLNEALSYFQQAIVIAKKYKDSDDIRVVSINLVSVFRQLNKPKRALEVLKNIDAMNLFKNDVSDRYNLMLGYLYVYLDLKEYDSAKIYFNQLIQEYKHSPGAITVLEGIIKYYLATRQYQLTYPYLEKYNELVVQSNLKRRSKADLWRFQADSALGKYQSAIAHYAHYKLLADSDLNLAKARQTSLLEIEYETEKKNKDLQLQAKDIQLLKNQSERTRLSRNWIMTISIMLLVLSGVLFSRYQLKQKSNRQLQAQQAEINKQNKQLQNLVNEKDWLLKEVHHRVKNNLQIVMSLLNTQSAFLENTAALEAITESRNRVQAISLIHQKLYSSNDVASIDMQAYIKDLANYLKDGLNIEGRHIRIELIIEAIRIDIAQAVPLGLILNEAITNAIKYAFDDCGGQIIIGLQMVGNENILLSVADNGRGLPADFDLKKTTSLGMEMMKALSKQLGGSFEIRNKSGVEIMIDFKLDQIVANNIGSENYYS